MAGGTSFSPHIKAALRNITEHGDTDVFPFSFENHVLRDRAADVVAVLRSVHNNLDAALAADPVAHERTLGLVGYSGFRPVNYIDPVWNAYLLALVLAVAPRIEAARVDRARNVVYSYRYEPKTDGRLFGEAAWQDFMAESARRAGEANIVLICDIADFYARIYHHRVENALAQVAPDTDVPSRVMKILRHLSEGVSYGLPVGGPAARLLSELVLDRVDRLLLAGGVNFCRYADDYHIFCSSRDEAYQVLLRLSELLLRNEGLTLQKAKTRFVTSAEFVSSVLSVGLEPHEREARSFLALSLRYDPYSPTAAEDYADLQEQIERFDITGMLAREIGKSHVQPALTRRLLQAIQFIDVRQKGATAQSLVENLDVLAPVLPSVFRALSSLMPSLDAGVQRDIVDKLAELLSNKSYYLELDIHRAYLLRVVRTVRTEALEQALVQMYDTPSVSAFVRRDIVLVLAHWRAAYWLSNQKHAFSHQHQWVQRALLVASYQLGDEGRHWRQQVAPQLSSFDRVIIEWMKDRVGASPWEVPI